MEYYNLFLDEEIMNFIIGETNRYGPTKDNVYIPTDNIETSKFLILIILMGYTHLPKLEDY